MRVRKKMIFISIFCMIVCLTAGCKKTANVWKLMDENQEINIAILGSEEYFNYDKGFKKGIDLAVKDIKEELEIVVNVIYYDDEGNYSQGVNIAGAVANDSKIAVALTLQDFEIIDTIASIFEAAMKPLIVLQGCYDETATKGYKYLITDCMSAEEIGKAIGKYAIQHDFKNIASCHTDTIFEKDEVKGFQSMIKSTNIKIVDMIEGPFTEKEFNDCYTRWKNLRVDALYLNFYSLSLGGEIIKMLKNKNSDMVVMTDFSINNEATLKKYKQYMEGTIIVPLYPYVQSERLLSFENRFQKEYNLERTTMAIQGYDMVKMIADYISSGISDSIGLMEKMKAAEGYEGVSGNIKFDKDGQLIVDEIKNLVCKNGEFITIDE